MNSTLENYMDLWEAKRKEYDAKADRLSAEQRLEYNKAFDDFGKEVEAATDWTEAAWKEFLAKTEAKWQELAIDMRD